MKLCDSKNVKKINYKSKLAKAKNSIKNFKIKSLQKIQNCKLKKRFDKSKTDLKKIKHNVKPLKFTIKILTDGKRKQEIYVYNEKDVFSFSKP